MLDGEDVNFSTHGRLMEYSSSNVRDPNWKRMFSGAGDFNSMQILYS